MILVFRPHPAVGAPHRPGPEGWRPQAQEGQVQHAGAACGPGAGGGILRGGDGYVGLVKNIFYLD